MNRLLELQNLTLKIMRNEFSKAELTRYFRLRWLIASRFAIKGRVK